MSFVGYNNEPDDDDFYNYSKKQSFFKGKMIFIIIPLLIASLYFFKNSLELMFFNTINPFIEENTPSLVISKFNSSEIDNIIREYKKKRKLPRRTKNNYNFILLLNEYKGKNSITAKEIKKETNKLIKKNHLSRKFYTIELDNYQFLKDEKYKNEFPYSFIKKNRYNSLISYAKLPNNKNKYINIVDFIYRLKKEYPNSTITLNLAQPIESSVLTYNTIKDLGHLSKRKIYTTISGGDINKNQSKIKEVNEWKYYTVQRISYYLLEKKIINPEFFKISLSVDQISDKIFENEKMHKEYLKMKIREGGSSYSKIIDKKFIEKYVDSYPQLFYSDNAPMYLYEKDLLMKDKMIDKKYHKNSDLATTKTNLNNARYH